MALDAAGSLQLVLLPFAPASQKHVEALTLAAGNGVISEVERMLHELQDPNLLAGGAGTTALHRAAAAGHRDVARLLLEAGADHDPPSRNLGRTPLHMAVDNGHASVVELLMDAGADKQRPNNFGQTPLWVASRAGNATILHALQDQG
ncbi:FANK1 [Symbiodinium microadriaticum]|nr:FANK1 [Symbiodinium sp. KB8]CAE7694355.1 FANK1 [Symbiodinium microadriaticum]